MFPLSYFSPLPAYMDLSQSCKVNPLRTSLWFYPHPVELFDAPSGLQWGRETSFSGIRAPFILCSCAFAATPLQPDPETPSSAPTPYTRLPLCLWSCFLAPVEHLVCISHPHICCLTCDSWDRQQRDQISEVSNGRAGIRRESCLFTISEYFLYFYSILYEFKH